MDPSTEAVLYSNPPEEKFLEWFKEYNAVFSINLDNQLFIYRRLTRREYKLLMLIENEVERANSLVETVVLWPDKFAITDNIPAGLPEVLSGAVLLESGFTEEIAKKKEELSQALESNPELQMETLIEYVFGYAKGKFDKYQDWSYDELVDAYVRAIWALNTVEGKQFKMESPENKVYTAAEMIEKMKKEGTYTGDPNDDPQDALTKFKIAQRKQAIRAAGMSRAHRGTRPPMKPPTK